MTTVQKHFYSVLGVLAVLCISTAISLAQTTTTDPFAVLPPSDALITLDLKRFYSDAVPRLLVNEQEARLLVTALPDLRTVDLLNPRSVQRLVVGIRYNHSQTDFEVVTVAQSSEAGQLPAFIQSRGAGKYREQPYAGKILYITKLELPKLTGQATSSDEMEWAIVALDANTLAFGDPAYVRSSIDVSTGKGATVSAELVTTVKRNPNALLSAAGLLPPSLMSAAQQLVNSDLSQTLSSLKRFYASVELVPAGFDVAVTLDTTSPEQSRKLADLLTAFKTVIVNVSPGKTKQDKVTRDLFKGLEVSAEGTEVRIRGEVTQANVNELAKQGVAGIYVDRGVAQLQKGDSDAAIAEFDKAIMLDSESANAFVNRGKARANKGSFDAAIADYDKATALDPDDALAYNNRCFVRVKKGDFDAAIVDCDKSIALDPSFAYSYNNRGLAFASQGKLDKAIVDYDKSIALDAENIFAYQNRGDARMRTKNFDGALADFDKALTINARSAEAYNGRGVAHFHKGELDQAIADYDKAIAINPNLAEAYGNRALPLLMLRRDAQAERDLNKCFELNQSLRPVFDPLVKEIKKTRRTKSP